MNGLKMNTLENTTVLVNSNMLKELGFKTIEAKHTFGFWGSLAWEIDRMTDNNRWLKLVAVPLLKILGRVDTLVKNSYGNLLILAEK